MDIRASRLLSDLEPGPDYDEPQGVPVEDDPEFQNGEEDFPGIDSSGSEKLPGGENPENLLKKDGPEKAAPMPETALSNMQRIVWACLVNAFAWVWCSYILAWFGRDQIAESLSQVALTQIVAVVLVYAVKSLFENLSKYNTWPDKPNKERK